MKKGNAKALLPIGVFLAIYLGLGLLFEYGMKIPMGFYKVPIIIAFLAAILVACLQNRKLSFNEKLAIMGCRTRVVADLFGENSSIGRGNIDNISINLPRLALEVDRDCKGMDEEEKASALAIFAKSKTETLSDTYKFNIVQGDASVIECNINSDDV